MSEVSYIKVWCEYDFNGSFGGNNNEEVFIVSSAMSTEDIETKILNELMAYTSLEEEDLEDLWDWEFIEVKELK